MILHCGDEVFAENMNRYLSSPDISSYNRRLPSVRILRWGEGSVKLVLCRFPPFELPVPSRPFRGLRNKQHEEGPYLLGGLMEVISSNVGENRRTRV